MFVHLVLIKLKPGVTRADPRVPAWEALFAALPNALHRHRAVGVRLEHHRPADRLRFRHQHGVRDPADLLRLRPATPSTRRSSRSCARSPTGSSATTRWRPDPTAGRGGAHRGHAARNFPIPHLRKTVPENERHRRRHRPRNPRFTRQPHHRSGCGPRVRRLRPRGRALRRVDRLEGGDGAARRRRRALRRQGRAARRRQRQHRDLRGDPRPRRHRAVVHRPHDDRPRRQREQVAARRQCDPGRVLRGGEGGRRGVRPAAVPVPRRRRRDAAAGPADERHQRRRAREQQDRPAGVHAGAAGRADVPRGAALRRRGLPRAEEDDRRSAACRRPSATRAASRRTCRATRRRCSCWSRPSTRRATCPAPTSRWRSTARRASSTATASTTSRARAWR